MAEFNDLSIWTDAILGDTTGLTDAEFGAYLRLLIAAWRRPEFDIPDDAGWMRRTAQTPANRWPARWANIEGFWRQTKNSIGEPVWVQKKLLDERDRRRINRQKQIDAANSRWDHERSKKQSTDGVPSTPVIGTPLRGGQQLHFQGLSPTNRICPAYAPDSRSKKKKEDSCNAAATTHERQGEFSKDLIGKNGKNFRPGTYTVDDPLQRIARFQHKLAQALGSQGWALIVVAMNPKHPSHETALAHCKMVARTKLNAGWPRAWPVDETLSIKPVGAA